jgi:hypothetical protein
MSTPLVTPRMSIGPGATGFGEVKKTEGPVSEPELALVDTPS